MYFMRTLSLSDAVIAVLGFLLSYFFYTRTYSEYVGRVNMIGLVHVVSHIDAKPDRVIFIDKVMNPKNGEVVASGVENVTGCKFLDTKNWDCQRETFEGLKMIDGTLSRTNQVETWEYKRNLVMPWDQRISY